MARTVTQFVETGPMSNLYVHCCQGAIVPGNSKCWVIVKVEK